MYCGREEEMISIIPDDNTTNLKNTLTNRGFSYSPLGKISKFDVSMNTDKKMESPPKTKKSSIDLAKNHSTKQKTSNNKVNMHHTWQSPVPWLRRNVEETVSSVSSFFSDDIPVKNSQTKNVEFDPHVLLALEKSQTVQPFQKTSNKKI